MATPFIRLTRAIAGGAVCAAFAAADVWGAPAAPPPQVQPTVVPPQAVKPPEIELRGRILGNGGKPIPGATVRILPLPAAGSRPKAVRVESGADGSFVAKGLTGAEFRIRVEAKGYAPLSEGPIPGGATLHLRLKPGCTVTGIVLDRGSRKPADAATILAWEKDAEIWGEESHRTAKSGKDGRFAVADLPAGKVTVQARAAGRATARTTATAALPQSAASLASAAFKPAPIELLLDPEGSITGRVSDTGGSPVAGAEVAAYWRETTGSRSRKARTDAEGHYAIAGAGSVTILRMAIRAKGFPDFEREGPAPSDGIVDFVIERGGTVSGVVQAANGKPPVSFQVSGRREGGGAAVKREFSDPSGAFRIEDLDPGTYTIVIEAEGSASLTKADVAIRGEQVADLGTLTLESKTTLRGRVLSARDESPVTGAMVRVSLVDAPAASIAPGTQTLWTASTSADGSFSIRGLAAGTVDVSAEQSAFAPARTRITFDPQADTPEVVLHLYRGGSLTGTVIDGKGEPVAGVRIVASVGPEADARTADTGSDGRYFMHGLTPATYQVTRQRGDGSHPAGQSSKVAAIREGETTTVDFDEAARILVSGTVRKGEEPLANTALYLFLLDGRSPPTAKKAQTDAAGVYQVGLDQGGAYRASVRMTEAGGPTGQNLVTLTIPDQPEVHQDIVFASNAIVGRITTAEGKGVKDAIVLAVQDGAPRGGSPRQSSTYSRADGSYRLDGIDAGTYRVTAKSSGYAPAEAHPVTVVGDQGDVEVDLTLERGWILRGRVVDPQGQPVVDAIVVVAAPGNAESGFLPSHTDRSGSFRVTSPTDGPINVAAISPRFAPAVLTDISPPNGDDPPPVELLATAGGTMRIRVVHRGGGPVTGAQPAFRPLMLFPGADLVMDRNVPKLTDADGMSVVQRLYPGTYNVTLVGRRDTPPIQVTVGEGAESDVQFEVP